MEVPDIRILNNKLYLNHSYTVENLNYLSIVASLQDRTLLCDPQDQPAPIDS